MTDGPAKDRGTELAEERTDLATKRTAIAVERTLMAWIRTSISMISFGFTLYKFLDELRKQTGGPRPYAARNLGLALIVLGTLGLVGALVEYTHSLKSLGVEERVSFWTTAFFVAIFVVLIGVLAFVGVWLRTGPF